MRSGIAILILAVCPCLAQSPALPDPGRPDPIRLDQIVQSYLPNHQFMGSVLIARGDQVVFSKGYGFANLEWDIPNSPATKFRLGSLTKQFTAASILLLEERGKLIVSDPVKKYMPSAPAAWDNITIFHLLTHTSGIPNFTSFPDYAQLEPFDTTAEQLVARFREKPLDFQPGEKWSYSNSGYVLLGYLIEKITGDSYRKFVGENIFTPLGMKDSGYDSNSAIIPHRATGYTNGKGGIGNAGFVNMTVPLSAGALYSTTEDLLKWEQGLFGGKLLRAASLEKMTTVFKSNYAFGLVVQTTGGHKVIQHGGGIEGFNTELDYYPDDKLTVAVLGNVNGSAPGEIATKLAALSFGGNVKMQSERKEIMLDPALLARYVGVYELAPGVHELIAFDNGLDNKGLDNNRLSGRITGQAALPMFAESETLFFLKAVDAQIEFVKPDTQGNVRQLILHQGGRDTTAKRLSDAEGKLIAGAVTATDKRYKDQTAAPGSEAALRGLIAALRLGQPNYDQMSPSLAAATRQQWPRMQANLTQLGAMREVAFKGVGPGGADIYEVNFEHGALEYRIWLSAGGKIERANVRPL